MGSSLRSIKKSIDREKNKRTTTHNVSRNVNKGQELLEEPTYITATNELGQETIEEETMSTIDNKDKEHEGDDTYINPTMDDALDDWDFIGGMDEEKVDDRLLPDNIACALNCGFIGVGGGGGVGM